MNITALLAQYARIYLKRGMKLGAAGLSALKPINPEVSENFAAILMYHRVNAYRRDELSIRPDNFRKQVQWLKEHGFQNLKMRELESCKRSAALSGKYVIFTFDDGYADNLTEALPILLEYGYTGIFYLATDYVDAARMYARDVAESNRPEHNRLLTWAQVHELLKAGMEIGSHTASHTLLTELSDEAVIQELRHSREILEQELKIPITSFCLPAGAYLPKHVAMFREAGYASVCTTEQGFWRGDSLLEIPRIAVLASDGFLIFKQKLTGRMEWFFRVLH